MKTTDNSPPALKHWSSTPRQATVLLHTVSWKLLQEGHCRLLASELGAVGRVMDFGGYSMYSTPSGHL